MRNYLENRERMKEAVEEYARSRAGRRLKYWIFALCGGIVALFLGMIIFMDELSLRGMLWIRGCCGVLACIVFVLCGILIYRSHLYYWNKRNKGNH